MVFVTTEDTMLDARTQYAPEKGPALITQAAKAAGSYRELAGRAGVSEGYLRQVRRGEKTVSFGLQFVLEQIIKRAETRERRMKREAKHGGE